MPGTCGCLPGCSVLCQRSSSLLCPNHHGPSSNSHRLCLMFRNWCITRKITIHLEHPPGCLRYHRLWVKILEWPSDWQLNREVFKVCSRGSAIMGRSVWRMLQFQMLYSWKLDTKVTAINEVSPFLPPPTVCVSGPICWKDQEEVLFSQVIAPVWPGTLYFHGCWRTTWLFLPN